jgi:hypothetical protein
MNYVFGIFYFIIFIIIDFQVRHLLSKIETFLVQ